MTQTPTIAIVGQPNVGKSTLFNVLTRTRDALVARWPGLTRDRLYGQCQINHRACLIVDTGGLGMEENSIDTLMTQQAHLAIKEADLILFLVDGRAGLNSVDQTIAQMLRTLNKKIVLVANKLEDLDPVTGGAEFFALGFGQPLGISAAHHQGIDTLIETLSAALSKTTPDATDLPEETQGKPCGVKIAIVGKPNVGKSTLVNRLLKKERVIVFDQPGTTRDSIFIPFEHQGKSYTLIDTAGVRRRSKVEGVIEKFSVIKTLQAIESSHVVVLIIDAQTGITDQDLHLLGFILEAGKSLLIAVNKWDGLSPEQQQRVQLGLDRRLTFIDFAVVKCISALTGFGVPTLFPIIDQAYASATKTLTTSELTKLLERATAKHQPPASRGRQPKLRFAHPGGQNPPTIIVHGKRIASLPQSYQRYLENFYREALKMTGTPVRVRFKQDDNPFT